MVGVGKWVAFFGAELFSEEMLPADHEPDEFSGF